MKLMCLIGLHKMSYVKTFYQVVDIAIGPESVIEGHECKHCHCKKFKAAIPWYKDFTLENFAEIFPVATNEYLKWGGLIPGGG